MSQINSAPFDELAAENGQVAKLKLIDSDVLDGFKLTQILDQDPKIKSANLLGEFITVASDGTRSAEQAILLVERTHFTDKFYQALGDPTNHPIRFVDTGKEIPEDFKLTDDYLRESLLRDRNIVFDALTDLGQNDIYTWLMAWSHRPEFAPVTQTDADIKLTLIRPATQTHIDKYSAQRKLMVYETPEMYRDKVLPWIRSFPPSRIQWVYNILEHKKESESILFERPDGKNGFIMVPDLKWDQKTPSSLYIQAIVHNRELRSMRDLTKDDVGMLEKVKTEASRVAFERYGLTGRNGGTEGNVRCFLHYQPSY
nr:conserved hypothetical protein [Melanopsichium pennsylvanicum 4]